MGSVFKGVNLSVINNTVDGSDGEKRLRRIKNMERTIELHNGVKMPIIGFGHSRPYNNNSDIQSTNIRDE
ncbi:hypothetical protein T02_16439 [Trichinella nativa]|nr:hypothetical protein T02_9549 [Trichinella nativa]KRZ47886.1 hypothetical protein T02_12232 [Trichinella nativa]KRZ48043.1 hypothetical protein T02_12774 [Trichinella nativa]KRZ61200.1 hypothetical protein T02_16439 [Trichinella nativa]